jgi:hypothetical protein
MFLIPLAATLLLAALLSWLVARFFSVPLNRILKRIIGHDIGDAWLKYLNFAIMVVGISSGVRVRELEKYTPMRGERDALVFDYSVERWTIELYRTAIDALQGITWMLLVFFVFAMVAYVILRIAEMRFGSSADWPIQAPSAKDRQDPA